MNAPDTNLPDTVSLFPTSMSCSHCVRAVREALGGVDGLRVEEVAVGEAHVSVDVPGTWEALAPKVRAALAAAGHPLPA